MGAALSAVLLDLPAASRDALEPVLRERFTAPAVTVLDGRTRVRTALIAAVQDQIAPLADPDITPGGVSFLDEIGVDPVQLRDDLARAAIRCIEQVGPGFPALTPLVTQLNADGILELGEAVKTRVDEILAGIERWQQAPQAAVVVARPASAGQAAIQSYEFPLDTTDWIADALLAIPSMADRDSRNVILGMLPASVRNLIPRSPVAQIEIYNIVRRCAYHEGGLRDLVRAIRSIERDSLPMRQLDDVILAIGQPAGKGESS
jgi:hypothetical protein